ncbi:ETEC_3214 domain-containing protein [Shewanella sp.]|uniref:ETEC_3214 domain-containing protein n=1 Tax=Shewanella sp. TaxID=50422 RepID=UPI00260D8F28|nr:ETEC_3214 domain-containing protein [Shewanella sp.]
MSSTTIAHSFWEKIQKFTFTIAAIVLAIGQWADFRDVAISSYEGFITHFTDNVELKQLSNVRVGGNLSYLESIFGPAKLIKIKEAGNKSQYRYYLNNKFLLTLAVSQERVTAYQVVSLSPTFRPPISFSETTLNLNPIQDIQEFDGSFSSDTANIRYYLEQTTLGREGLFFERQLGFVEYGSGAQHYSELDQINEQLIHNPDNKQLLVIIEKLRSKLTPNIYSVGELSLEEAADMLLTRYEFHAYFGQGKHL